MSLYVGLEHDSYKYVFGVYQNYKVPFDEHKDISIVCGKNDRAALQLLLYAEEEMLVCVNDDTAFFEKGPIDVVRVKVEVPGLENGRVHVQLIGLVEDDDRQLKSDILLHQPSIHVEKRRVQPVWIELELDPDVQPGLYTPQITVYRHRMFEDEAVIRNLSFQVEVLNVGLKRPADSSFYLDLWQHNANIARKYDVELWSEPHFAILDRYVASLAELGQKAITVIVSEIPWSGQASCYDRIDPANLFEYNMIQVTRHNNEEWTFDFSVLNRYVDMCMKHGIQQEIEVFGLLNIWVLEDAGYGGVIQDYDDAVRIRYFDESSRTFKYMRELQQLKRYIEALETNFVQKGWIDKVRLVADEPLDIELFTARLQKLKKMAPKFQFKVAVEHTAFMEKKMDGLVDYVFNLDGVSKEFDELMALATNRKGRLLYYVSCTHKVPNTFIGSRLLESRAIPWLAWYWQLDGFLRWNYTVWPNDPLKRISYHFPLFPAGDTNFVYPGRDGRPMLSLRYKQLQRGIRDYEIFTGFIRQGGSREQLLSRLRKVFLWNHTGELHFDARNKPEELFSFDPSDYEDIMRELLTEMAAKA